MELEAIAVYLTELFTPLRHWFAAYDASGGGARGEMLAALFGGDLEADSETELANRLGESSGEGGELSVPFESICSELGLNAFERFTLTLALACDLDERYAQAASLFGSAGPTLGFALRLYSGGPEEAVLWRSRWLDDLDTLSKLYREAPDAADSPLVLRRSFLRYVLGLDSELTLEQGGASGLAKEVPAVFAWDDLVLPEPQKISLRAACDRISYAPVVYDDWGFSAQLPYGRGLRMLFAGPPGTGKTMAAQVMARELGMKLYKVNLSALVSKYIGETEKNLASVFEDARLANNILFFDEADSLFGKRVELRDSHDRYANMQTAYLLQAVEDYDGTLILATNMARSMDAAFTRRIQLRVDFTAPAEDLRREIWKKLLGGGMPLEPDLDLGFLAGRFELTGAEIKNIVITAAFLAASRGKAAGMREMTDALITEYAKDGKILAREDLGQYV